MRHRRYKERNNYKYLIVLVLAAIVITCFAYPYFYSALLKTDFNPNRLIRVSGFKDSSQTRREFAVVSGQLASFQGTALKLQSGDGSTLWQKEFEIEEPLLAALDNIIVAADTEKGTLIGIDLQGSIMWRETAKGRLLRVGTDRKFVWVVSRYQQDTMVEVLNDKGESAAYFSVGGAEVFSVSLSADGSYIVFSTAEVKDGRITGSIVLYNKDGTMEWAKSYRDSLVMRIKITDEGFIHALKEDALVCLDMDGSTKWQRDINGYISKVLLTNQGVTVLTLSEDYRNGVPGSVREETFIYDKEGGLQNLPDHRQYIEGLVPGEDCVGVYSARRLRLIDYSGKAVIDREFDRDLIAVFLLEDGFMAYISADKIYFESYL